MKVVKTYSFKKGEEYIKQYHKEELQEVLDAIQDLDAISCLTKLSEEKNKVKKLLFSPPDLNKALKTKFCELGWTEKSNGKKGFIEPRHFFNGSRFREMDGLKNNIGLEIQFGKYAFMGYDIFSKMVIFNKLGKINCGIEIVPVNELCKHMSSGVSDFDQLLVDFEFRGESNIDIPVFVVGIGLTEEEENRRRKIQEIYLKDPAEALKTITLRKYNGVLPGPKKLLSSF